MSSLLNIIFKCSNKINDDFINSLKCILNQTNKDFRLTVVNDGCEKEVADYISTIDFSVFKEFEYFCLSSYSGIAVYLLDINYDSDYIFFVDEKTKIKEEFADAAMKILSSVKPDMMAVELLKSNVESKVYNFDDPDLIFCLFPGYKDKIFLSKIFHDCRTKLKNQNFVELLYLLFTSFKTCYYFNSNLLSFVEPKNVSYNLYDIFEIIDETNAKYGIATNHELQRWYDTLQFFVIYNAIIMFLVHIFAAYKGTASRNIAINKSKS
jgi:hypothetical protein